ncbi:MULTISPECIES: hypothetical protein [Rhizobium]|uniref:Uncharacterized protein n=1 Tax=Rhizobium tropici TaxID=398 RepID=A0A6P1C2K6_RHITR|nr:MULTISPECIES: hypothetical protein [Rhizobium]AGB70027.1 hypothetical protein RTCIAT899_CH03065 [Rhizobium tropici CIAT 899]MBB4239579.1 hypothetical protein [Rhizobium tropici]MBB5590849.1 hypothetical protein [Rhizobium tropici]MBB6489942.1 hypothetical protein [Rhizobium tropici]NEV09565.1 hypothetical protein [Rhizobium tropici]
MSLKAVWMFLTGRWGHVALAILAWPAYGAFLSSPLLAQDAAIAPSKPAELSAGARLQAITDGLMQALDIGPDLNPQTIFKILPGDWANIPPDFYPDDVPADAPKMLCAGIRTHFNQPRSGNSIFDGWIGREGSSRFELRLTGGGNFYWISNVQDEMQRLGLDKSTDAAMALQRGLLMQRSVQEGGILPLSNDVVVITNTAEPSRMSFWVRCLSDPEDSARNARNIQLVNTMKKRMTAQAAFLSYGADGSVPFMQKMQGAWTIVDELSRSDIRNRTVSDLCHIRRIEMKAEHQPLPILTAHVADTSSSEDRPVPAAQDEFELQLAGDRELLRIPLHGPMLDVKQHAERFHVPPVGGTSVIAERQRKEAIAWYRRAALSSALPVNLVPVDEDTLVESATSAWGKTREPYGTGIEVFKRYWLRCPA